MNNKKIKIVLDFYLAIMPFAIDKILVRFGFILIFTLLIDTHTGLAIDVAYPKNFLVSITFPHAHFILYPCFN